VEWRGLEPEICNVPLTLMISLVIFIVYSPAFKIYWLFLLIKLLYIIQCFEINVWSNILIFWYNCFAFILFWSELLDVHKYLIHVNIHRNIKMNGYCTLSFWQLQKFTDCCLYSKNVFVVLSIHNILSRYSLGTSCYHEVLLDNCDHTVFILHQTRPLLV